MIQLNKTQIVLSFIALAALRLVIGFHFFDQGMQKFRAGGFDSSGFLSAANGPFSPFYHQMIPDRDGKIRLCYDSDQKGVNKINPAKTLKIWETYKNFVVDELIKEEKRLVKRRQQTKTRLEKLGPSSEEYLVLNTLYQKDEATILAIRESRKTGEANLIFETYKNELTNFLMGNEEEINYYFQGESRLEGFQRDSEIAAEDSDSERERVKRAAAKKVNLLRQQVKTIENERKSAAAGWLSAIDGMWKGLEHELLNMVPLDKERKEELRIELPTESAMMKFVNQAVPYFDVTIGALLILGLFTRFAAMGAGLFLVSILMSQAAILGESAAPTTILHAIETAGAFVVAATCAGRYAGLDYFIHATFKSMFPSKDEDLI